MSSHINPHGSQAPRDEQDVREDALDETLANTFPASDPPSTIPNPDDVLTPAAGPSTESDEDEAYTRVIGSDVTGDA